MNTKDLAQALLEGGPVLQAAAIANLRNAVEELTDKPAQWRYSWLDCLRAGLPEATPVGLCAKHSCAEPWHSGACILTAAPIDSDDERLVDELMAKREATLATKPLTRREGEPTPEQLEIAKRFAENEMGHPYGELSVAIRITLAWLLEEREQANEFLAQLHDAGKALSASQAEVARLQGELAAWSAATGSRSALARHMFVAWFESLNPKERAEAWWECEAQTAAEVRESHDKLKAERDQ